MVDERQRVIRDLILRLEAAGIAPDEPFTADFLPGQGWRFSQESREPPSSSSTAGGDHATVSLKPQAR